MEIWKEADKKLSLVKTKVHRKSHIRVDEGLCKQCPHFGCTRVCPATCYRLFDGKVKFSHDGCLECGTCDVVCDQGAVTWNYPTGGYGVMFRLS